MIVSEALRSATAALRQAGIEEPAREARILIAHVLGQSRSALLDRDAEMPDQPFGGVLARRVAREPMALILGHAGFWTLELTVSPATLIPRPETETLIEIALRAFPDRTRVRRVLDLGTGTGALLLAALSEFPDAYGVGVDRSPAACALARDNARRNSLADRASLLCANWMASLRWQADLILANPPYVRSDDMTRLMPEVGRHEPASALDGGPDGLDAFRALLPALSDVLAPDGLALLECGIGQADALRGLAMTAGFSHFDMERDLAGIPRVVMLRGG